MGLSLLNLHYFGVPQLVEPPLSRNAARTGFVKAPSFISRAATRPGATGMAFPQLKPRFLKPQYICMIIIIVKNIVTVLSVVIVLNIVILLLAILLPL